MRKIIAENVREKILFVGLTAVLLLPTFLLPSSAHAASYNFTAKETWDASSCTGTVNDAPQTNNESQAWEYVNNGDQVNLTVTNSSTQTIGVSVSGPGQIAPKEYISPNNSASYSLTVSTYIEVEAISTTCSGNSNVTNFWIEGATGSLSCSVSDSKVWNVNGQYNGVEDPTLYSGSSYETTIQNDKGGLGVGGANVDLQFSGETNPVTYYLYDGSSSADPLIGQTTCPAIAVAATSAPTSHNSTSPVTTVPPTSPITPSPTPAASTTLKSKSATISAVNLNEANTNDKFSYVVLPWIIVAALLGILMIVSFWKVFTKTGRHGWIALIPIYNLWVLYEVGGYPGWWAIVSLIPLASLVALVIYLLACLQIASHFGKSKAFGVLGLFLFGFVGWPMLAFGRAIYKKTKAPSPKNVEETRPY